MTAKNTTTVTTGKNGGDFIKDARFYHSWYLVPGKLKKKQRKVKKDGVDFSLYMRTK